MNHFGASGMLHILDDFLFIANSKQKCEIDLANFLKMYEYLDVL